MKKKPVKNKGRRGTFPANVERSIAILAKMASRTVKWQKAVAEQQKKTREADDEQ